MLFYVILANSCYYRSTALDVRGVLGTAHYGGYVVATRDNANARLPNTTCPIEGTGGTSEDVMRSIYLISLSTYLSCSVWYLLNSNLILGTYLR